MTWTVKEHLTEEEIRSGKKYVIGDSIATQAIVSLTTGAFLVAFALEFGASNFTIGFLAAIPPLAQLIQIPAVYLVERLKVRRAISFYSCLISRCFFLLIGLSPLFVPHQFVLPGLLSGLFAYGAFAAICTCSWNSWMRDLIPISDLGEFNSKRLAIATSVGMIVTLTAGYYVDRFQHVYVNKTYFAFSSLFILAYCISLLDLFFIASVPEPRMQSNGARLVNLLIQPLNNRNFRNLLKFLFAWNIAVNLAAPFFTVYMFKKLELIVFTVIALGVLSQTMNLLFFRVWGKLSDRFGHKSVLKLSGPLFLVCVFGWTFTSMPGKHALTMPLLIILHGLMGIATAGTTLGAFNIAIKLAPNHSATPYLASASMINSIAAGLAPVLGGLSADYFAARELSLNFQWRSPNIHVNFQTLHFSHWDFFFFMAFLVGCIAIVFLKKVKEQGEVGRNVIITELVFLARRRMRNLSTIGGIRWMVEFPFSLAKNRVSSRDKRNGQ